MIDRTIPPHISPYRRLTLPRPERIVLDNGLKLCILRSNRNDMTRMDIVMPGGSYDTANRFLPGVASVMLTEGNSKADGRTIAETLDFNGARLQAIVSSHNTTLRLMSLASRLTDIAAVAIDCLISPTFPQREFEAARQTAKTSLEIDLSRVSFLAELDNMRLVSGDSHPASSDVSPRLIADLTPDHVADFHYRRLDASATEVFLSGNLTDDVIKSVIAQLMRIPINNTTSYSVEVLPFSPQPPAITRRAVPGSLQSAVRLSLPAVLRSHPDYNYLRMTVIALGGYFGSRLMSNIREQRGLTYGISAALCGCREGGYVTIACECDNANTDAVIEEVRKELIRMAEVPLAADELIRIQFHAGAERAATVDNIFNITDYYELCTTLGITEDYFDIQQDVAHKIDAETICKLSHQYLRPEELRISVAGDFDTI